MDHAAAQIGILRGVLGRRLSFIGVVLAVLASAFALSACGDAADGSSNASASDPGIGPLPTRNPHAKAIEPVAGESGAYANMPTADATTDAQPKAQGKAAKGTTITLPKLKRSNGPTDDAAISNADVLKNGIALPPIEAPEEVREIIDAGNQIARTPYLWGGGHGKWLDHGYDCSGSVSFALANAGLLRGPQTSGALTVWGAPGKGKWITIYANAGHVFMEVAGVRFDTSGNRVTGSRWQANMRPTGGFVARHPPGL
jgi:cell wall-associated NlpC family hydrolase